MAYGATECRAYSVGLWHRRRMPFSSFVLSAISHMPFALVFFVPAISHQLYALVRYNVWTSTDNTAGRSLTIGSQLSPPLTDP